ncbi:MAG: hypothetical protein E7665_02560 [Ruminococcaceae bacterium]|nr:hypothetical protein [Oscillospiraceae bacterium]
MSEVRFKIHMLSAQMILAYAKSMNDSDVYTFSLNKRETESVILRHNESTQDNNAIFFQIMCELKGNDYKLSSESIIEDLADVIVYIDFSGIFGRDAGNPRIALRQKKAESMFRPDGITLDLGNGAQRYFAFERSASMSRKAVLSFLRADVYNAVHSRMMLDMKVGDCQLSKLYAYNGLLFSSGTRIEHPDLWRNHSIVILDNPHDYQARANVITMEDVSGEGSVRKYERREKETKIPIIEFDGEGLISPGFAKDIDTVLCGKHIHHSFQIRMPYIKGMVHEVDFPAMMSEVGITFINDIWGNPHPVDSIKMILTKSQFKGFNWLNENGYHWYRYIATCERYNQALYVTGVGKENAEDLTELNYQFLNTLSLKSILFRPSDLPMGWEHSPEEDERNWLTKATEQRYYDLTANDDFRRNYFISRAERWSLRKKSKNYRMAQLLRKNPLFINESYFANELDAMGEQVLKDYAVGKLYIKGDNRYLSADLMELLYYLIEPHYKDSAAANRLQSALNAETFVETVFYAPGSKYEKQGRYTLLRNPHIARNEEVMVKPLENVGPLRQKYLSHLTDVVMVGSRALIAERLGGADFDGDMIKTIAEPILNDCVFANYFTSDYNEFENKKNLPLLQIPSVKPQIRDASDWYARFETVKNTFSSRVGQISNAALERSIIAYDENTEDEVKAKNRRETEELAILTGLEIDSAKSGIKPDLSGYLGEKKVKRSSFLKYKKLLENSEERRQWYEPTFEEQFKEYFDSTNWQDVSSNLEKLPYYAQMLKKNTPKAKRKPAKASELFTFACDPGWDKKLDPEILERIKTLVGTYETCLKRIRASQHLPNVKAKKKGINRVLFMRNEENNYDADELYALFVNLPADRVSDIRRAISEEKYHFMTEEQRILFLRKYLPEDEFEEYYDLFSDFRCGGYRLLGDLIIDTDNDNAKQNRGRLRYEGDLPEMTMLVNAYINKALSNTYREAVADECLKLVKRICNPATAVKYVVALNKRSFLWDVLWDSVEKFALKY